jgi:hypothetical protein
MVKLLKAFFTKCYTGWISVDVSYKMPNRLFKLLYRTERSESIRTVHAGGTVRTGGPIRSFTDCTSTTNVQTVLY